MDDTKLTEMLNRFVGDLGATMAAGNVVVGHRLGLFRALANAPGSSDELARRTDCDPRYVAEWLRGQAAGGYVTYDADADSYSLSEEQAFVLANPDGAVYAPGAFVLALGSLRAEQRVADVFRSGKGIGWHEHDADVFVGCEQFFRPGYLANLTTSWLPALDGVEARLRDGASVADVGCGLGASTILMAEEYPNSTVVGFDYHDQSVELAAKRAADAGVAQRTTFEVASAQTFTGSGYDLVTTFDCLHDMGDPTGAARHIRESLADEGTWMIVEPYAGDSVPENLNPVGRVYYGFSTFLCVPNAVSQSGGYSLGAQAGSRTSPRWSSVAGSPGSGERPRHRSTSSTRRVPDAGPDNRGRVGPMRARQPDSCGYAVRSGVRLYWEVYGEGPVTILLLPTWATLDSRVWKLQVAYLARHFRVVVFDPRGNGRSDRPRDPLAHADSELVEDAVAVLEATDTSAAVCVGLSMGGRVLLQLAVAHPDRVLGAVFVAPSVRWEEEVPSRKVRQFEAPCTGDVGWARYNAEYWQRDLAGFAEFFFGEVFSEAHSTKQLDDAIEWTLQTDAETLIAIERAPYLGDVADSDAGESEAARLAKLVRCPSLVVYGDDDRIVGVSTSELLADALGCEVHVVAGGGHCVQARHPVRFNLVLRRFVESIEGPLRRVLVERTAEPRRSTWLFARERKRRALWVCSPIGLGHVLRDLAIARSLRESVGDLEIHWLAQQPVTAVLEAEGEIVHPASGELASESAHWESEASGHDLHAFHAFRRLDEVFCANYLLFDDVVRETPYDLWVGDEAWDVDHFLHENPERKRAPYAFLTDVIGFLPVDPDGDPREAELCADYNAEMIEQLARFPYIRDRSLFIGGFDELPDASLGAALPGIREWSRQWYASVPYVVPFDPAPYRRTRALRNRLGYGTGYPLYVAAVGGTAVGRDLLELTAEAFATIRKQQPDARMVMVTGPRLHPGQLPDVEGMDKLGYVPSLFEHLACADVAVVQGGLSTTMELVAARRPFVYFPLGHHWEQQHFVTHRLDHYHAGLRMDYESTTPGDLATAMMTAREQRPAFRAVPRRGAAEAAGHLAALLTR